MSTRPNERSARATAFVPTLVLVLALLLALAVMVEFNVLTSSTASTRPSWPSVPSASSTAPDATTRPTPSDPVSFPPSAGLTATGAGAGPRTLVLCDGQVHRSFSSTPIVVRGPEAEDASIQKVIRNCTFRDGSVPAISIERARNVLVERNTFVRIRSGQAGQDTHAITMGGAGVIEGITIRDNSFRAIGADGIQMAGAGRAVSNVLVEGNDFSGTGNVGENAIDVKGVDGPVLIRGNTWTGFRPCDSPGRGGDQDCSGSDGAGVVVHAGDPSGRPRGVAIIDNSAVDNTVGFVASHADDVLVAGNSFRDSLDWHIVVNDTTTCVLGRNTFDGTGSRLVIDDSDCVGPGLSATE